MGEAPRGLPLLPLTGQPAPLPGGRRPAAGHHSQGPAGAPPQVLLIHHPLYDLIIRVVEDLSEKSIIEECMKEKVLGVLLYRHKHVHPHSQTFKFGLKRSMSQRSIQVRVGIYSQHCGGQDEEDEEVGGMIRKMSSILPLGALAKTWSRQPSRSEPRLRSRTSPDALAREEEEVEVSIRSSNMHLESLQNQKLRLIQVSLLFSSQDPCYVLGL